MSKKTRSYRKDWENVWKDIVENPDGTLNKEQIKKELSDFSMLMDNLGTLIDLATGGRASYPHTEPETVYDLFKEQLTDEYNKGYEDGREEGREEGYEQAEDDFEAAKDKKPS